jgi:hypothetical protein
MSRTERLTVHVILTILLLFVPAFLLHTSTRFAGSLAGSAVRLACLSCF